MERWIVTWIMLGMIVTCNGTNTENLIGKWRLDSVQYYYNNFSHSSTGWYQEETYEYLPTDELVVSAVNAYMRIPIIVSKKEIHHLNPLGETEEIYSILKLNRESLVLQVDNTPLFAGNQQSRYEIRYFSRVP
ncbi:MAG: hypothetical protein JJU34_21030 [Lunatimonas sp.]|uniref:hypothetical protein n=1 Tax=Lunatimonas sp. TaxID=2060141 RepID=UPI00263B7C5A|nr:hypothetical protein [Lunatimonas sp.]MCC5939779.1 hypothetical protein [Lunatimonas sp.]